MRSPSGAEDIGSANVGVAVLVIGWIGEADGVGEAAEIGLVAIKVGKVVAITLTVGIGVKVSQATNKVARIIV